MTHTSEETKIDRRKYLKEYYITHKEEYRERARKWYLANLEERREHNREYYAAHKEEQKAYSASHRERRCEYIRRRRTYDPNFKILMALRTRLRDALKSKFPKSACTLGLLGCSVLELRAHLELQFKPGMTWENHGPKGWHIDHVVPCASFDLTDPMQQQACFHYTNLQPLWAEENIKKGAHSETVR